MSTCLLLLQISYDSMDYLEASESQVMFLALFIVRWHFLSNGFALGDTLVHFLLLSLYLSSVFYSVHLDLIHFPVPLHLPSASPNIKQNLSEEKKG